MKPASPEEDGRGLQFPPQPSTGLKELDLEMKLGLLCGKSNFRTVIIWLASYPRSGNTFFRIVLHNLFGFQTHSLYSVAYDTKQGPGDTDKMMHLVGQVKAESDLRSLQGDGQTVHFVKTHEMADGDHSPAIAIIRDGRDAVVSYAHFILRTELGVDLPSQDLLEATLDRVIRGDNFGGWSRNVNSWVDRVGLESIVRYEDLVKNPIAEVGAALKRLGIQKSPNGAQIPSFENLRSMIPWFFRIGKVGYWRESMPACLQRRFLEMHGDALLRLGYSDQASLDSIYEIRRP